MILQILRSWLWKLELGFSTNGLISPRLLFRLQTLNARDLGSHMFFMSSSIEFWISYYFQILGHFWQSYECLFQGNCKNPFKIFFLVQFHIYKFPLKSCLKNPVFCSIKIQISPEPCAEIQKMSLFWNFLIKGFQLI